MLDFFNKLMQGGGGSPQSSAQSAAVDDDEKLRLAATALLFRALFVDGTAHPDEEEQIRRIVTDAFALTPDEVAALMDSARTAAQNATDLHGWTRLVNAEYTDDEKQHLLELLWRVVLADGVIEAHEHALMRRLAGLIYVSDADSARARNRAKTALGQQ